MGVLSQILQCLTALFFVGSLAVCGGVFNHLRGSNGGAILSADAFARARRSEEIGRERERDRDQIEMRER